MKLKLVIKYLQWIIITAIILSGITYFVSWKSPDYYTPSYTFGSERDSIIPFSYYSKIADHPRPYIITSKDKYTIFGATHTRDPNSHEIELIEKEWKKLNPTVALIEGRLGFLLPGLMNPVKYLGEGGKVKFLSEKDKIPLYNWDLPKETLAMQLLEYFNAEQIALAQILSPYFSQMRFSKPDSPEKFIEQYLKRAVFVGQENNIKEVDDIDRLWKKYFPVGEDWRAVDDQYGLPGYLEDMAGYSNDLRNKQLVSAIKELTGKGEKVFIACGSSHTACISVAF